MSKKHNKQKPTLVNLPTPQIEQKKEPATKIDAPLPSSIKDSTVSTETKPLAKHKKNALDEKNADTPTHPIYGKELAKETPELVQTPQTAPILTLLFGCKINVSLLPKELHKKICTFIETFNDFINTHNSDLIAVLRDTSAECVDDLLLWLNEQNRLILLAAENKFDAEKMLSTYSVVKHKHIETKEPIKDLPHHNHHITTQPSTPHHTSSTDLKTEMDNVIADMTYEIKHNWRSRSWGYLPIEVVTDELIPRANPNFKYTVNKVEGTKNATIHIECLNSKLDAFTSEEFQIEL